MKFLESFEDRYPDDNQIKYWEEYLDKNYNNFSDTQFGRMLQIDDKSYFIKNKGDIINRIFYEIKSKLSMNIHDASLRRAIKNWIDRNNI
jgi:hypothetical protein